MSTKGLLGIDSLRAALHEHADDAKSKAEATMADVIETERQKAADMEVADILKRRLEQEADDKLAELDHIAGQRAYIAFGRRNGTDPVTPAPAVVDPVTPDPADPPTAVTPPVPDPDPALPPVIVVQPRSFLTVPQTRLQWLLAIIGAIIGLVIARVTYDPMWSHVDNDTANTVLIVVWFVVLTVACFFTGGMLGAMYEEHRNRNNPPVAA